MGRTLWGTALAMLVGTANIGCGPPHSGTSRSSQSIVSSKIYFSQRSQRDPIWSRKNWIARLARTLTANRVNLKPSEVETLLLLSDDDILDTLIRRPEFEQALISFNLFFLGFPRKETALPGPGYNSFDLLSAPGAITAAKAFLQKRPDFFESLIQQSHPFYTWPLFPLDPSINAEENAKKRNFEAARILSELDAITSEVIRTEPLLPPDYCKRIRDLAFLTQPSVEVLVPFPFNSSETFRTDWRRAIFDHCPSEETPAGATQDGLGAVLGLLKTNLKIIFDQLPDLEPSNYKVDSILELRALQIDPRQGSFSNFNAISAGSLSNSSTNRNRKRAAFVLKTFFCDDLTPITIENDPTAGTVHGSEASCRACHYKLDPMAGLFRELGAGFRDFSKRDVIRFDDDVVLKRKDYEKEWLAPPGSGRIWNIGFIRDDKPSSYKTDIAGLFELLRDEPEVKACFVKRAFQYFVSPRLIVSPLFLESLTQSFSLAAQTNSAHGFKNLLFSLLKSEAYRDSHPDPERCYDSTQAETSVSSPSSPGLSCVVQNVIQNHCLSCHDDISNQINLQTWRLQSDGIYGFDFIKDGKPRSAREGFKAIEERLSSTNPSLRMPENRAMPSEDRSILYRWVTERQQ